MSDWQNSDGYPSEKAWIAARVRSARAFRDLTQTEFAQLLGIERKTVGGWEDGEKFPGRIPNDGEQAGIIKLLELRSDWFSLPLSQTEVSEGADVAALRHTADDMGLQPGKSHSAVLRAVREARKQEQDPA